MLVHVVLFSRTEIRLIEAGNEGDEVAAALYDIGQIAKTPYYNVVEDSTWETSFTQSASMIYSHLSTTNLISTFNPGIPTTIDELSSYEQPKGQAALWGISPGVVERESIATTDSAVESKTDSPLRIEVLLNWKVLPQPDN